MLTIREFMLFNSMASVNNLNRHLVCFKPWIMFPDILKHEESLDTDRIVD